MDPSLFDAIADACLSTASDAELARELPGFLRARGVPEEDIAAIVAERPRLATYRMLVRNNLTGVVAKMLARTRARMGAQFDETFEAFLADAAPRTHYLRDVPAEFLAYAAPRWRALGDAVVPSYLVDLAEHELAEFAVATLPGRPPRAEPGELALDRGVVLAEAVRLVRHAFAVHELPTEEDDRTVAAPRDVRLLVYRDAEHTVRTLELTPLADELLKRLVQHREALGTALEKACLACGTKLDDTVLASTAHLLADLADRGVLLGSAT